MKYYRNPEDDAFRVIAAEPKKEKGKRDKDKKVKGKVCTTPTVYRAISV